MKSWPSSLACYVNARVSSVLDVCSNLSEAIFFSSSRLPLVMVLRVVENWLDSQDHVDPV